MKAILLDEAKKWLEENCENQYTRMAVFGIMQSMPTVDYQKTPNEPLTLEELREMDAVVKDISDLIDEVEEIRRGYGIDDSDADKALADMCGNYCENEGDGCYIEGEKYHCENFKWRGPQKEE